MRKNVLFLLIIGLIIGISNAYAQIARNALNFDGNDDYISLPNGVYFDDNTFTIESWVFLRSYDNWCRLIDFANGAPSNNIIAALSRGTTGYPHLDIYNDGVSTGGCSSTTQIPLNTWAHIAYVLDGTNAYIYLNGKEIGSSTTMQTPTNISRANNYIGESAWTEDANTDMQIDEFRIWSDAKSINFIRENMYKPLSGSEANLLVYYQMAEGTGLSLDDASSNSYTGTLHGNPTWAASGALDGARKALDFDGTDDFVLTPHNAVLNVSTVTIEMWMNWANNTLPNDVDFLIGKANEELEIHTGGGAGNNTLRFIPTTDVWLDTPANSIEPNKWTHVAFVYDPGNTMAKAYINGKEVSLNLANGSLSTAISSSVSPLLIGARVGGLFTFEGKMDEVRIWSDVRSESEIRENMTKSLAGNEANLVAYYKFNEGDGTILNDYTSNGNDGTLTNMDAATDWVTSEAFNTWIGTENVTYSNAANWSDGIPASTSNVGIYKWTLPNVTTYNATISGLPTINNLLISSTSTPSLSTGMTVNGSLLLEKNMNLNGQTVTIGSSGTLIEGSGVFSGTTGSITTTRALNNISALNVGGLGAVISTAANMGSTTITRTHSVTGYGNRSVLRKYNIAPTTNTGLNATLTFNYLESELNSNTETNLKAYKSTNSGTLWSYEGGTVDAGNNNLTIATLDGFSLWTLSDKALNEVIYVDADAVAGNDGSDWTNAFTSLQSALNIASSGNQIWVAEGTYKPSSAYDLTNTSRFYHFRMKDGLAIYGGFAGTENLVSQRTNFGEGGANETILSGDLNGDDGANFTNRTDNCYHVFYHPNGLGLSSSAILDGFTIKGGNANGTDPHWAGGAMFNNNCDPNLLNLVLTANRASYGAAMYNTNCSPTINRSTFSSNNAINEAGAIYNNNSSPSITNCLLTLNSSDWSAVIYNYNHSNSTITNSIFANNSAIQNGGAIRNHTSSNSTITNCTFANNSANSGGAISIENLSAITMYNSILWGNNASTSGKQIYVAAGSSAIFNYSCYSNEANDVSGAINAANFNITNNPKFVDAANNDFRINGISPCLDAGNSGFNSEAYDIRGTGFDRKLNKTNGAVGLIDMGAYEYKFGTDPMGLATIQASNIQFSNITRTGMTVRWTRGDGEGSLLLAKEQYRIATTPLTDGVVYENPNTNYTSAPSVGGAKMLYNGSDANPSINVTGLTRYKLYYFRAFAYNNAAAPYYLQTENATNPRSRWTLRRDGMMEEDLTIDAEYAYPNPASYSISTTLDMFEAGVVSAKLYDAAGRVAAELYNQSLPFGTHKLKFDISSVASGVYQLIISKGSEAIVYPVSVVK